MSVVRNHAFVRGAHAPQRLTQSLTILFLFVKEHILLSQDRPPSGPFVEQRGVEPRHPSQVRTVRFCCGANRDRTGNLGASGATLSR